MTASSRAATQYKNSSVIVLPSGDFFVFGCRDTPTFKNCVVVRLIRIKPRALAARAARPQNGITARALHAVTSYTGMQRSAHATQFSFIWNSPSMDNSKPVYMQTYIFSPCNSLHSGAVTSRGEQRSNEHAICACAYRHWAVRGII